MTDSMNFEVIDLPELGKRWNVPATWVRNRTRQGFDDDPLPVVRLGKYVRVEWNSPQLTAWWARRRSGKSK
jgi:hypothetical protein